MYVCIKGGTYAQSGQYHTAIESFSLVITLTTPLSLSLSLYIYIYTYIISFNDLE